MLIGFYPKPILLILCTTLGLWCEIVDHEDLSHLFFVIPDFVTGSFGVCSCFGPKRGQNPGLKHAFQHQHIVHLFSHCTLLFLHQICNLVTWFAAETSYIVIWVAKSLANLLEVTWPWLYPVDLSIKEVAFMTIKSGIYHTCRDSQIGLLFQENQTNVFHSLIHTKKGFHKSGRKLTCQKRLTLKTLFRSGGATVWIRSSFFWTRQVRDVHLWRDFSLTSITSDQNATVHVKKWHLLCHSR